MATPPSRRVVAYLDVVSHPPGTEIGGSAPPGCIQCGAALDMQQPDPDSPDRMLGVCPDCKHWHVTLLEPMLGATLVKLPLVGPLRDTWGFRDGDA